MKKEYIEPEADIILFTINDIVRTSGGGIGDGEEEEIIEF